MQYGSTKGLLDGILQWLKTSEDGEDQWQRQTEHAEVCLAELVEVSEPPRCAVPPTSRYIYHPFVDKVNRAMPHVSAMLAAMRERNRRLALTHGEAGLRRL